MEFPSVGQSLKRHWSSHKVEINAGISEAKVKAFEEKYGVILPDDVRDYFRCVNGMAPDEVDDDMMRFWMLEEIEPLPQGAPEYSDGTYVQSPETLFLFADYSLWAHAYAIRLGNTVLEANEVIIIGGKSPKLISASFSKFVGTYLTSKDLLH